jgi:hypothetical protein
VSSVFVHGTSFTLSDPDTIQNIRTVARGRGDFDELRREMITKGYRIEGGTSFYSFETGKSALMVIFVRRRRTAES